MMSVTYAKDERDARTRAGAALTALLTDAAERPRLLLVSGGSAMKLLTDTDTKGIGNHTTIGVLDERCSVDPTINNFLQLTETKFYMDVRAAGAQIIETIPQAGETVEKMAQRFERALRGWKNAHPDGKIIITQGIGQDGHTAGIMPYPDAPETFRKLFEDESRWVVGYDAGEKNQYPLRVTVTMPFLKNVVDVSIVYAAGKEKQKALEHIFSFDGTLYKTPARIIKEMKKVMFFTDIVT